MSRNFSTTMGPSRMRADEEPKINPSLEAYRQRATAPVRRSVKETVKALADGIAILLVVPALAIYFASRPLMGERAFAGWSQAMALLPGTTGIYLRRAFYRLTLKRCGSGCQVSFGTTFSRAGAELGRDVYIGGYCTIGDVTLGDDVLIASHVSIINGGTQHGADRLDVPIREQVGAWTRVTIGRDSWVGERAVVMADVGDHCIVGAGSVVTRALPDLAVAAGCPAKVIRYRGDPVNREPSDIAPRPAS